MTPRPLLPPLRRGQRHLDFVVVVLFIFLCLPLLRPFLADFILSESFIAVMQTCYNFLYNGGPFYDVLMAFLFHYPFHYIPGQGSRIVALTGHFNGVVRYWMVMAVVRVASLFFIGYNYFTDLRVLMYCFGENDAETTHGTRVPLAEASEDEDEVSRIGCATRPHRIFLIPKSGTVKNDLRRLHQRIVHNILLTVPLYCKTFAGKKIPAPVLYIKKQQTSGKVGIHYFIVSWPSYMNETWAAIGRLIVPYWMKFFRQGYVDEVKRGLSLVGGRGRLEVLEYEDDFCGVTLSSKLEELDRKQYVQIRRQITNPE